MKNRTKNENLSSDNVKNKNSKKVIVIWLCIIAVTAVVSAVLLSNPSLLDKEYGEQKVTGSNGFYDFFYEADFSLSLEEYESYPEYLELDRYLYFKNGNETVGVLESNRDTFGDEILFFEKYFDTIISGDSEAYNALFTEEYYKSHEMTEEFTPQMLYGMEIELLGENEENGILTFAFNVSYKIFQNNGTFRNDIYSDAVRPIYVEISDAEGEFKINALKYYVPETEE